MAPNPLQTAQDLEDALPPADARDVEAAYAHALHWAHQAGDHLSAARAHLGRSRALRLLGQGDDARAAADLAAQLAQHAGQDAAHRSVEGAALLQLAELALDEGHSKDAHDHLVAALEALDESGDRAGLAAAARAYGEHLAVLGAWDEARAGLTLAARLYRELGDDERARWVEEQLAHLAGR
ncbi:MAG: hypothetical protein AB2A00_06270 [Myxococcota bacterium]